MSSSQRSQSESSAGRPETPAAGSPAPGAAADPYASWLDRVQRAHTRHAAITRNLHSWANYKSWAEKMKSSWDEEEQKNK